MNERIVVVVEDDRAIRDVLTELLRGEGYTVIAIGDGPSAFQKIQQVAATYGQIAAITLDLTIPGKDGASILQELRTNPTTKDVPVVIVSANTRMLSPETRPLASAVIRKPFDVMHLLETVASVIAEAMPAMARFSSAALANRMAKS